MAGKNHKSPKWAAQPDPKKQPRGLEAAENVNQQPFRWRCNWIDLDGEWGFRAVNPEHLWKEVLPRLHDFETMTWAEISGRKDSSNHPMPVSRIEAKAAARLTEIGKQEYDTLFQLNVRGGIRLWGIRDRAYFYLLWFDPSHTVYVQK